MRLLRDFHDIPKKLRHGCVTIGNFDGVHGGHQALLAQLRHLAQLQQVPTVVITFEPHPQEYFQAQNVPARLTRLREKYDLLACHVDLLLCLRFNQQLARLSATEFVQQILVQNLQVSHLLVGHDFVFGNQRQGDFNLLEKLAATCGFTVGQFAPVECHQERISSSRIRQLLAAGNLSLAEEMLGRAYSMQGRVMRGDGRGRELFAVPTANIALKRKITPLRGVYAVTVRINARQVHYGVANIGTRPTVDGTRSLLEVHVLDFTGDLYQQHLEVFFLHKLRDEQRYSSIDALATQIHKDVDEARDYFSDWCQGKDSLLAYTKKGR